MITKKDQNLTELFEKFYRKPFKDYLDINFAQFNNYNFFLIKKDSLIFIEKKYFEKLMK